MPMRATVLVIFSVFFLSPASAEKNMTPAELEKWFYEDESPVPVQVDEGELVFLEQLPDKPLLHSINEITIDANSIENGWVLLKQCYKNLDAVSDMDIVYRYRFIRKFKITSTVNIGSARINEQLVELGDVKQNAEICINAEVRVFYQNPDRTFSLVNGPYHRKFLDGYFPYHVTLVVNYPSNKLKHISNKPLQQSGFTISHESNKLLIDTVFAGTLNTEVIFQPKH